LHPFNALKIPREILKTCQEICSRLFACGCECLSVPLRILVRVWRCATSARENPMTKKHFIALADAIREHNSIAVNNGDTPFTASQLETLADAFQHENSNFMRERWLAYVAGQCGKNGGTR
jgi:hypothetical protein